MFMVTQEEIKAFLEGNDPEEHIVAIELITSPTQSTKLKKSLVKENNQKDTFTAFAWVGDLQV
jgi:hypothetical protein